MKTVVVSRHESFVRYLQEIGLVDEEIRITPHVRAEDVRGAHVIGILPPHLAEEAALMTVVPLDLTLEQRERERTTGEDLSIEEIRAAAGEPRHYRVVPVEEGRVGAMSDGYHTYDELYEHRNLLLLLAHRLGDGLSLAPFGWMSRRHADGSTVDGYFVVGLDLHTGSETLEISYHLPDRLWDLAEAAGLLPIARGKWDGHTASDVVDRIRKIIEQDVQI